MASAFEFCCEGFSSDLRKEYGSMSLPPQQRWVSMAAGAGLAAYGLSRLSLRALTALGLGGYLVYRGAAGRCPLSERLARSGLLPESLGSQEDAASASNQQNVAQSDLDAFVDQGSNAARSLDEIDVVDEAAMESFPASDAPGYTGTAATPSKSIG